MEEDVYGEDALPEYREMPGSKWQEQTIVLPAYPSDEDLMEVDLGLSDYPFTLWIDKKSLSVGEDRVIRYTAVLRSKGGAENVVYEGIRCPRRQVQTYAVGSGGKFLRIQDSKWRFIRTLGQDRYRDTLTKVFFCPLPMGNAERQIRKKLKRPNPKGSFHYYE